MIKNLKTTPNFPLIPFAENNFIFGLRENSYIALITTLLWAFFLFSEAAVSVGLDVLFQENTVDCLKDKKVGLIINQTSVNSNMRSILSCFHEFAPNVKIAALFSPEHGLTGKQYAWEWVADDTKDSIPVHSLHGERRRPTREMLKGLDVLIYDIQCTGVRAYTYPTTLFYMMEEAAKEGIEVIVLDRPNPINGLIVDGPLLQEKWRSYIGYINVPYCHGMTIGELAQFFNIEYHVGCKLQVIAMKGWKRHMHYRDTGLAWIPPSPNIPEPDTPLFSCTTGAIGELQLVNIGIGYTLPFKIIGAPWIKAFEFADKLNAQQLPGVHFHPYHFRPFWGLYKGLDCEGVFIQITNYKTFRPLCTQYLILGLMKSLYPIEFNERLKQSPGRKELFCKAIGTDAIYEILIKEKFPAWKLLDFQRAEREIFLEKRKHYLLDYPE